MIGCNVSTVATSRLAIENRASGRTLATMSKDTLPDEDVPPVTEAQMRELRARLAHHRAHPDEPKVTLEEIRRKLLAWRSDKPPA